MAGKKRQTIKETKEDTKLNELVDSGFLIKAFRNGRPPKYDSEDVLIEKAAEYFDNCKQTSQLPEKAGLCLYLGISKDTYSEYRKKGKFPDAIKKMDALIESNWVRRLGGQAATGAIFYLKNAFRNDYKDRHETDITSKGEQVVVYIPKRNVTEETPPSEARKTKAPKNLPSRNK